MKLARRLETVISLITDSNTLADIGTDHGMLACAVLSQGKAAKVIATDISLQSLNKARKLLEEMGFGTLAEFRQGDGLEIIKYGEVDAVVITGMGGRALIRILKIGEIGAKQYIFSPQSEIQDFRRFLVSNGYQIVYDGIVESEKRFYNIIKCIRGIDVLSDMEIEFGRTNINEKSTDFINYLNKNKKKYLSIQSNANETRKRELQELINRIEEVHCENQRNSSNF